MGLCELGPGCKQRPSGSRGRPTPWEALGRPRGLSAGGGDSGDTWGHVHKAAEQAPVKTADHWAKDLDIQGNQEHLSKVNGLYISAIYFIL